MATGRCASSTASMSGVEKSGNVVLTSHPFSMSARHTSKWPLAADKCKGAQPCKSGELTLAPNWIASFTALASPMRALSINLAFCRIALPFGSMQRRHSKDTELQEAPITCRRVRMTQDKGGCRTSNPKKRPHPERVLRTGRCATMPMCSDVNSPTSQLFEHPTHHS